MALTKVTGTGLETLSDGVTITTADNTDQLTLISTEAGAAVAPNLRLYRNSGSPADADQLGKVLFGGRNDNAQDVAYAQIGSQIKDASDGVEVGRIFINSMVAGTSLSRIDMTEGETVFNNESANLDFRVETDGSTHMLVCDGEDDVVLIDTDSFSAVDAGNSAGIAFRRAGRIAMATVNNGNAIEFFAVGQSGKAGSISVSGTSTTYGTSSDVRLKDNIQDADDASSKVDAIQVRQFDWKTDGSHQDYGMIAQELQIVAPEAVSGDADSEDMMSVDYSKLIPLLVKTIQELEARITALEG